MRRERKLSPSFYSCAKNLKFQENYVIIKWEIVAAEEISQLLKFDGAGAADTAAAAMKI